ncbi:hypothetical protein [Flavobacterium sp. BFFFF1]|uniref:hypothetical protein n=1 Tax=Flavobacterium sp. BFFFF1 TaxID=2015557 RepID=UPI0025B82EDD|nr:hypothetical protein [Flavobacterium sp. BFFFF1]
MKKLLYGISAMLLLLNFSCVSDEDTTEEETLSNNPVTGTVFGRTFTVNPDGGKASNILSNGVEGVYIYLTATSVGCGLEPETFEYPVIIFAPRAIGTHTTNTSILFKDLESDDFVSAAGQITVEIISVGDTVVGRVLAPALFYDNHINGRFEVPYCN